MATQSLRGVGERKARTSREEADVQVAVSRVPTPVTLTHPCPLDCDAVWDTTTIKGAITDDG